MPKNNTLVTSKLPTSGQAVFRVISSTYTGSTTRGVFSCKSNADAWLATQKDTHWYKTEKVDVVFDKVDHPDWSMMDPHTPTLIELVKEYAVFMFMHPEYFDSDLNPMPETELEAYLQRNLKQLTHGTRMDLAKTNTDREESNRPPLPKPDILSKLEDALKQLRAKARAH